MAVTIHIQGSQQLIKAFAKMDDQVRRRILRYSLRRASEPIVNAAHNNVRGISETIAESISAQAKSYRKGAFIVLKIGPSTAPQFWRSRRIANPFTGDLGSRLHKPGNTAHLVELGTKPHTIKVGKVRIKHPGTQAQPYLEPARQKEGPRMGRLFEQFAWKAIERQAKQEARKS